MSVAVAYLPPMLAMVALSFLVALLILVTRALELIRRRRPVSYFEDFDGAGASSSVMRPTRQLANLFELPVLFYTATLMAVAIGLQDNLLPALCWLYAALRWLHALSHLILNRLWLRTPVFMAGNIVLLIMWGRIASLVLC